MHHAVPYIVKTLFWSYFDRDSTMFVFAKALFWDYPRPKRRI